MSTYTEFGPDRMRITGLIPERLIFFGPKKRYNIRLSAIDLLKYFMRSMLSAQLSGVVLSDLQWLSKISNYKNCRAVSLRTTFQKVIAKILKIPMDQSSRTREWLPSVLILRVRQYSRPAASRALLTPRIQTSSLLTSAASLWLDQATIRRYRDRVFNNSASIINTETRYENKLTTRNQHT